MQRGLFCGHDYVEGRKRGLQFQDILPARQHFWLSQPHQRTLQKAAVPCVQNALSRRQEPFVRRQRQRKQLRSAATFILRQDASQQPVGSAAKRGDVPHHKRHAFRFDVHDAGITAVQPLQARWNTGKSTVLAAQACRQALCNEGCSSQRGRPAHAWHMRALLFARHVHGINE